MSAPLSTHVKRMADLLLKLQVGDFPERVEQAIDTIVDSQMNKKMLMVCGNGGSAADSIHISAELLGRFVMERPALRCVCLASNAGLLTAWSNDYKYETVFSRQVEAYGEDGAVLLGLSTSGNSPNVVMAFERAREMGVKTIAMTGQGGGKLAALSDYLIDIPTKNTPDIQQAHVILYHYICAEIDNRLAARGMFAAA